MSTRMDHITAAGLNMQEAARHLSQRLGFTVSRGEHGMHLRVLFEEGYLNLLQEGFGGAWEWSGYTLAGSQPDHAARVFSETISPVIPDVVHQGGPRPQDAMEPERARAVVQHANTAVALSGVMVLVKELDTAVGLFEEALGRQAEPLVEDSVLGTRSRAIRLGGGQRIEVVTALATGPAAHFAGEKPAGIFAPIIRVRSLKAAADALRSGATYSYFSEGRLFTAEALPGLGAIMFEEA